MKTLVALSFAFPALAFAQQQVVKPPVAVYWLSAETAAGMSVPGMSPAMAGMMGGQAESGRRMHLELASQRPPAEAPRADHFVPQGLNMGASLPLLTPRQAPRERAERHLPESAGEPRGRMLVFWGCGDMLRAGQPVVIDFAAVGQGQVPPGLASRRVQAPAGPSPSRARTYGDWPNQQDARPVPAGGSLRGEHRVAGNYTPEIRFALGDGQDFLERVELAASPRGTGASQVRWNAVPNATGYFATVMGAQSESEVVFWSSSESQEMGGMLLDFVPPAEVARLVREKVVMAPQQTECVVPAEVVKRAGGAAILNFIAYGPEANFVQPPRPQDPKQPWEQLWTVKVRHKSTASTLLGEGADDERRGSRARRQTRDQRDEAPEPAARQQQAPAPDPVKDGVNILRGIFGR
ncbi:MAG: hypothetical protein IT529_17375 [Burkholderiales bacterium]|nr:hypothetical protein [Burkholderiales bacterium]